MNEEECDCDTCKLGRLMVEFKQKGADPEVVLEMVQDVMAVVFSVDLRVIGTGETVIH